MRFNLRNLNTVNITNTHIIVFEFLVEKIKIPFTNFNNLFQKEKRKYQRKINFLENNSYPIIDEDKRMLLIDVIQQLG